MALANQSQYAKAVEGWSMHDFRRVGDHHCLHYVLLHLNEGWRGLHAMVATYLRKYWASNGDQMPA